MHIYLWIFCVFIYSVMWLKKKERKKEMSVRRGEVSFRK